MNKESFICAQRNNLPVMVFKKATLLKLLSRAIVLWLCIVLPGIHAFAQKVAPAVKKDTSDKVTVNIIHIDNLIFNKTDSGEYNRLIGGVILQQGTDTLYCDSAYQNTTTKNFEAFSNVKIAQQDGTQGKSDYLKYTSAQKLAYMRGNVSLTDGKNNLKTEELTYDLGAKIGTYYKGGTLYNDSTKVTSNTGVYNSNTKDSRFTGNAVITDPEYTIRSEDLLYNTETKITRFYAHSVVTRDSGKSILETSNGTYDGKHGIAHFIGHSSIWNDNDYIEGDSLDYNKLLGHGIANGHVICIDTAHHSRLFCGHAEYFHRKRVLWASIRPVLEQVNAKDTFYMRSDTMYSAPMVKGKPIAKSTRSKAVNDTSVLSKIKQPTVKDSLKGQGTDSVIHAKSREDTVVMPVLKGLVEPFAVKDTMKTDTLLRASGDSLRKQDSVKIKHKKPGEEINWIVPSGAKYRRMDTLSNILSDTAITIAKPAVKNKKKVKEIATGRLSVLDTSLADTNAPMYFVGWNHVLLFSDSMQGKCDSIVYTRSDSIIRMINTPIVWAHNSQITGDTILLQLDSSEMRSMYVPDKALVVSQSGPPKAQLFDQVQGKTLTAWFMHNTITHINVIPDAECIYYSKDEHGAYMGMDQAKSVQMIIYFQDQKIINIKFLTDDHITVTPLERVDIPNAKLSRFKWIPDDRPKSKEELFK
jgi:lipopolysaccharide export system protein LptA